MTNLIFPASAALLYSLASFISRRALDEGAGIMRQAFIVNQVFVFCFLPFALFDKHPPDWSLWAWPLLTGFFFFLGQGLTFAAIRTGDVSLQTPIMGTKSIFVVIIAATVGVEVIGLKIWVAAFLVAVGVILLALPKNIDRKKRNHTLLFALSSSLSFAVSDVLVSAHAAAFGPGTFLLIAMLTCALLSWSLVYFFRAPLKEISSKAWPWVIGSALLMGVQAVLLNQYIAQTGKVAEANIIYSTRGLWSVILALFLAGTIIHQSDQLTRSGAMQRFLGAGTMMVAVVLLFV